MSKRLTKTLELSECGDMKPTQILRMLQQNLQGMHVSDEVFTQIFLNKLPQNIRGILVALGDNKTPSELADFADKIFENMGGGVNTVAATQSTSTCSNCTSSREWDARLTRLENLVEKLVISNVNAIDNRSRPSHRYNSRSHSRSQSRSRYNSNGRYCYYHFKFGNNANKCQQPCGWKTSGNDKTQKNGLSQ